MLKIAHHGSKSATTSAFLEKAKPIYAAISVEAYNQYGHPHIETLAHLQEANAYLYRTDMNGSIVFKSNVKTISVSCSRGITLKLKIGIGMP